MSAIARAVKFIHDAYDLRYPNNKDAKPDLLILIEYLRKADAALKWCKGCCECGKIENETGICPICEAINVRNTK